MRARRRARSRPRQSQASKFVISSYTLSKASIQLILIVICATGASSAEPVTSTSPSGLIEAPKSVDSAGSAAYGDDERRQEKEAQLAQMADQMNQQHSQADQLRTKSSAVGGELQSEESAPVLFAIKAPAASLGPPEDSGSKPPNVTSSSNNSSQVPKSPQSRRLNSNESQIEDTSPTVAGPPPIQDIQERELTPEMLRDPSEQESDKLLPKLRRQQVAASGLQPKAVEAQPVSSTESSLATSTSWPTNKLVSSREPISRPPVRKHMNKLGRRPGESFASSLQPKHVSPPLVRPASSLDAEPMPSAIGQQPPIGWAQMAPVPRAPQGGAKQLVLPIHSPASLILRPLKSSPAGSQAESANRPLVSSLKSKSFGHLLPRLAAKLFTGELGSPEDTLNQQQSYQQTTHFSPASTVAPTSSTRTSRLFITPRTRLVKNFFARKQPNLLSTTPSPPMERQPVDAARQFVLMNGRLYSIVSAPQTAHLDSAGSSQTGQSPSPVSPAAPLAPPSTVNAPIFDHQTSDTSEFPVFEAMSMQANSMMSNLDEQRSLAGLGSSATTQPANLAGSSQVRCDRPRHVIQADRMVVNHILQSQQNFVIARVPIKKLSRPGAESMPSATVYQAHSGGHYGLEAQPAGLSQPFVSNFVLSPAASRLPAPAQQQAPLGYQSSPAIQFSASIERPSIWQSFVNLMTGIRRKPHAAANSPSANSLLLDGPLLVAAGRRLERRFEPASRRSLPSSYLAEGAYLSEPMLSSGTSAQSSLPQAPIDPMRRLLMLKTATDDEVCTPVGELAAKIKYSCVPNHCVVMALANSSAIRYAGAEPNKYQHSASSVREHKANVDNQSSRPINPNQGGSAILSPSQFTSAAPLVTYTHVNAYQTPAISRIVQPQHQHIDSSSQQVLDSLAQQDFVHNQLIDDQYAAQENSPLQTSMAELGPPSPLVYVQLPIRASAVQFGGHEQPNTIYQTFLTSTARPMAASMQPTYGSGSVTFGTVRTSSAPSHAPRWAPASSSAGAGGSTTTTTTGKPNRLKSSSKSSQSAVVAQKTSDRVRLAADSGPNDFVTAVDEQLERPIRVKARRKRKPRPSGLAAPQDSGSLANRRGAEPASLGYNQLNGARDEREPDGDSAYTTSADSLVNKRRRENISLPIQDTSSRHASASKGNRQVRLLARPALDAAPDEETSEEELEEDSPNDYDDLPAKQEWTLDGRQHSANMSLPMAVARKTRRDQYARLADRNSPSRSSSTTGKPLRYGLRQSTPLPAPEKPQPATDYEQYNNNLDLQQSLAEDLNEPGSALIGQAIDDTTTDCDCAKTSPLPGSTTAQPAAHLAEPEGQPRVRQSQPQPQQQQQQQQANIMLPTLRSSYKRNPTTLRPIKSNTSATSSASHQGSELISSDNAQDRRREASTSSGQSQFRYSTTRRPYNLRNTTYKNLPLTGGGSGALVANFNTAAVSLAAAPEQVPATESQADVSSTTATVQQPSEHNTLESRSLAAPRASQAPSNDTRTSILAPGNNTHFDDSYAAAGPPEQQPPMSSYESTTNLLPVEPSVSTPLQADTGSGGGGERYHESNSEFQDRISAILSNHQKANQSESLDNGPAKSKPVPTSVNDILAQTRGESTSASNEKPIESRAPLSPLPLPPPPPPPPPTKPVDASQQQDAKGDDDDDDNDANDVMPHQYQIQVRWNNSSSSEPIAADLSRPYTSETAKKEILLQPLGGQTGVRGFELDRLREQVRDRLFEHREEEHWHERQRQRLAHRRRKLVDGQWKLEPASGSPPSELMRQLDYGPGADQRETPVKDQLSDWPSAAERERHFAIPTRNFRQSAKFLDWVQRDVDLNEEPGEPKARGATQVESSSSIVADAR